MTVPESNERGGLGEALKGDQQTLRVAAEAKGTLLTRGLGEGQDTLPSTSVGWRVAQWR